MKRLFLGIPGVFLVLSLCGCAALLVGGAGGMAVSKDTAKLEIDTSFERAWEATTKTLEEMGGIVMRDENTGKIEASVNEAKVIAQVTQITPKSVRIQIKARKNLLPDVDLAVEIINKINSCLS